MPRDEFSNKTKGLIAKRAAFRCSNPSCQRPTQGPDSSGGVASIGVAAHISAAASGGPRFRNDLSDEERRDSSNGIWLCQTCSRLIDSDENGFSETLLQEWKAIRELSAALELRGFEVVKARGFAQLEKKIPKLVSEMRDDLRKSPLIRRFFCTSKKWSGGEGEAPTFCYYHEEHEQLLSQLEIAENYQAIIDITTGIVPRFRFSEDFVDYLAPQMRTGEIE